MSEEIKFHIILLPRNNYWGWVQAVREYAIAFGVSITPLPDNALRFHRPNQVVSIVNAPDAYPVQGDILQWFSNEDNTVLVELLEVSTPDALSRKLGERIVLNQRFGTDGIPSYEEPGPIFQLRWPVDAKATTQEFGLNPELYSRFGLPGHEGIDFRAPMNANVYACADGEVNRVHDGSGNHPYGIHVRLRHADGYKTIYAHLNRALVHLGQEVKMGDLLGLADSTGNSTGSHLHLTLKKEGATAAGLTNYPYDIIDPTPFLYVPGETPESSSPVGGWEYENALVGLNGRSGAAMDEADWEVVETANIEALKLSIFSSASDVEQAKRINPDIFLMVGLTSDFRGRAVKSSAFAASVAPAIRRFYDAGVRYFEIHSEPNITPEGYGKSWRDGHAFGEWFLEVIGHLRPQFLDAKFGWPGLSPGTTVTGMRVDYISFLESAGALINQADWIGCHSSWYSEDDIFSDKGGGNYRYYRDSWPDKVLLITQFSNPLPNVDDFTKANQYRRYYQHLRLQRGIGAAFGFVSSAEKRYQSEVWRSEDGQLNPIAGIIGSRSF